MRHEPMYPVGGINVANCPHKDCKGHGLIAIDYELLSYIRVNGATLATQCQNGHIFTVPFQQSMIRD